MPLAASGEVYRWVDDRGNLVFSDTLPAEDSPVTRVQEIHVKRVQSIPAYKPPHRSRPEQTKSNKSNIPRYVDFVIAQPHNGTALRDDAGKLTVQTRLEPALSPGHIVVLKMDGQPIAEGSQTEFQLFRIDRGTHTINAEVKNQAGRVLISTPPVSFTLLRNSLLSLTRQPEQPTEPDGSDIVELFPLLDLH